jgi:hypothetical protein
MMIESTVNSCNSVSVVASFEVVKGEAVVGVGV